MWEAIGDETIRGTRLNNVLWIVDLNRQSLDRVIPGIKVQEMEALFRGIGWQVVEAKYSRRLQATFSRPGGETLRRCIDDMPNEEYQELVRMPGEVARARLIDQAPELKKCLADSSDAELTRLLGDLGGHDLGELLDAFLRADASSGQPTVLFAYTMKGWGLPFAGDPLNHSALLSQVQIDQLRGDLCVPEHDEWACFPPDSPEAELCRETAARLYPRGPRPSVDAPPVRAADVPDSLPSRVPSTIATQEVFGNALVELARLGGQLA